MLAGPPAESALLSARDLIRPDSASPKKLNAIAAITARAATLDSSLRHDIATAAASNPTTLAIRYRMCRAYSAPAVASKQKRYPEPCSARHAADFDRRCFAVFRSTVTAVVSNGTCLFRYAVPQRPARLCRSALHAGVSWRDARRMHRSRACMRSGS